jgi:hypothetical protein
LQIGLATRQGCQTSGAFPLDKGLQGFSEQTCALKRATELLGLREQLIIKIDGCAHGPLPA